MEWSWRTVMILLGLLAMVMILVDGFRRMRRARAEALRLDVSDDFKFPEEGYNPELPGEVRVVSQPPVAETQQPEAGFIAPDNTPEAGLGGENLAQELDNLSASDNEADNVSDAFPGFSALDDEPLAEVEQTSEASQTSSAAEAEQPRPDSPLIPKAKPVNLDEQVPVLLDVEELGDETEVVAETAAVTLTEQDTQADVETCADDSECSSSQPDSSDEQLVTSAAADVGIGVVESVAEEPGVMAQSIEADTGAEVAEVAAEQNPPARDEDATPTDTDSRENALEYIAELEDPQQINDPHLEQEAEPEDVSRALNDTSRIITQPVNFAGPDAEVLAHRPDAEVVLVIHTIPRTEQGFKGSDLIYLFNSCDLRYGEKNIFHRFEEADGAGCVQFSVSQCHEPGTFEPARMADQYCRGLSFFMSLPGARRPLEAYEAMYEMAMVVSRNLKADMLDESLSALTPQTVEANRQEIMDFERYQHLLLKKQGAL